MTVLSPLYWADYSEVQCDDTRHTTHPTIPGQLITGTVLVRIKILFFAYIFVASLWDPCADAFWQFASTDPNQWRYNGVSYKALLQQVR